MRDNHVHACTHVGGFVKNTVLCCSTSLVSICVAKQLQVGPSPQVLCQRQEGIINETLGLHSIAGNRETVRAAPGLLCGAHQASTPSQYCEHAQVPAYEAHVYGTTVKYV